MVVADVGSRGDGLDAVGGRDPPHRDGVRQVERAIVDPRQDVAVEIDHDTRMNKTPASVRTKELELEPSGWGVELPAALSATNAATSCASFPVGLIYARDVANHASQTLEREFLEFAPDAVIGVDQHGEIRLVNSRTQAVLGYARDELIGQHVEMLVPEAGAWQPRQPPGPLLRGSPDPPHGSLPRTSTSGARTAASFRARSPCRRSRPTRG